MHLTRPHPLWPKSLEGINLKNPTYLNRHRIVSDLRASAWEPTQIAILAKNIKGCSLSTWLSNAFSDDWWYLPQLASAYYANWDHTAYLACLGNITLKHCNTTPPLTTLEQPKGADFARIDPTTYYLPTYFVTDNLKRTPTGTKACEVYVHIQGDFSVT